LTFDFNSWRHSLDRKSKKRVSNNRKKNKRDKKARINAAACTKKLAFCSECPLESVIILSADAKELVDKKRKELDEAQKKRTKVSEGLALNVN
jgi:hypothetical protein